MENEAIYPMRINKYLASKNICSRREADVFIRQRKITINGKVAVLGDRVKEGDQVEVAKNLGKNNVYLAFNKPKEIITHSPQGKEKSIEDIIKFPQKVFPVGRLDKDSHGLLLLTNDGRVTDKLLNPDRNHEKEYVVKVNKEIISRFIRKMSTGIILDGGQKTKECKVKKINENTFSIILTEGKKRQIRRMCAFLDYAVTDLKRVRILNIKLQGLKSGQYRKIEGKELADFLKNIGL